MATRRTAWSNSTVDVLVGSWHVVDGVVRESLAGIEPADQTPFVLDRELVEVIAVEPRFALPTVVEDRIARYAKIVDGL